MIDFILGDLYEEYGLQCDARGVLAARLWYLRQVLLSLPVMIKPIELLRPLMIAFPLLLLDRLWCLVYSMIPLKDGLDRAPGFLIANIVCGCMGAAIARPSPLNAALAVAFALAFSLSTEPPLYIAFAMIVVPLTAHLRRSYEMA
jgi:hypothetical protein